MPVDFNLISKCLTAHQILNTWLSTRDLKSYFLHGPNLQGVHDLVERQTLAIPTRSSEWWLAEQTKWNVNGMEQGGQDSVWMLSSSHNSGV